MEADTMGFTEIAEQTGDNAGDENLAVRFHYVQVQDKKRSDEEGRPIFKDLTFINIRFPGNKTSQPDREATEMDKKRFPNHYSKFLAREDQEAVDGTPLTEWPAITRSQVEELKFFNVLTVEHLANMSDANSGNIMGLNSLKQKAKTFLHMAKEGASLADMEALKDENADLKLMMADMKTRLDAMDAPKPKRTRRTPAQMAAAKLEEAAAE